MSRFRIPLPRLLPWLLALPTLFGFMIYPVPQAGADQPHYYILLEEGNEQFYTRSISGELDFHTLITQVSGGVSYQQETTYHFNLPEVRTRYFHMNEEGDVWELPEPAAPQEDWTLILDMPLTPGKTWGASWGEFNESYTRYTVGSPEIVHTVFGEMTAVPVHFEADFEGAEESGCSWYADGYGKVHWIRSCFGCEWYLSDAVIDTEPTTWGSLKALYH